MPLFAEKTDIYGSLNDDSLVREIVTSSIKASGKSREQIAEEMTLLLGLRVTERMITAFTAESKEMHRWPGAWDRAFCRAVHDERLLTFRAELSGLRVIGCQEAALLELGRQHLVQKRASQRIAEIEHQLGGIQL